MKKSLAIQILTLMCALPMCAQTSFTYKVNGVFPVDSFDGNTVYMMRMDKNKKDHAVIDSAKVSGRGFTFEGQTDGHYYCRIMVEDTAFPLILDEGTITADFLNPSATGTKYNDRLCKYLTDWGALADPYKKYIDSVRQAKPAPREWQPLASEYFERNVRQPLTALVEKNILENTDNGIALMVLTQNEHILGKERIKALLPQLGDWLPTLQPMKDLVARYTADENTAEGKPFADIVGTDLDGNVSRLSDYVGKGKYVLADMWASWCGPCKAEIPNIAELYNTYKDKGLVVLGIATWDKIENIKKALPEHNITWPQLFDKDNGVGNVYGVNGIPHIILFAPDGTILARNLRGDQMKQTVKEAMEKSK